VRDVARATVAIGHRFEDRIEEPQLRVRIGLHAGDAVFASGDYLGTPVNKVAREAAAAMGGEIVASNTARALLEDDPEFVFGESHSVELRGIEGVHEISRLLRTARS
jgi:class 3 adenylate cyclase